MQDGVVERAMPLDLTVDRDEPDHPAEIRVIALQQREQEQRPAEPAIAILERVDRQEAKHEFCRDQQGPGMLADRLVEPEDQVPHRRLGLRAGWGRVEHDPALAGVVIDGNHLFGAGLVAVGIGPGGGIETEQGVVQAADGTFRQREQVGCLEIDDARTSRQPTTSSTLRSRSWESFSRMAAVLASKAVTCPSRERAVSTQSISASLSTAFSMRVEAPMVLISA